MSNFLLSFFFLTPFVLPKPKLPKIDVTTSFARSCLVPPAYLPTFIELFFSSKLFRVSIPMSAEQPFSIGSPPDENPGACNGPPMSYRISAFFPSFFFIPAKDSFFFLHASAGFPRLPPPLVDGLATRLKDLVTPLRK